VEHLDEHLAASLQDPQDRRLLLLQGPASRSALQPASSALSPFFWTSMGLPLCPATM
jgi:hypothetical protein